MSKRILLCDDELHILRAAEFKFKRAGYEVVTATDGERNHQVAGQCAEPCSVVERRIEIDEMRPLDDQLRPIGANVGPQNVDIRPG